MSLCPSEDRDPPSNSRRWDARRDAIVTEGGATLDFSHALNCGELRSVTDDDVVHLLTPGVEHGVKRVVLKGCENLTDVAITSVAEKCPNLAELDVSECLTLTNAAITVVAEKYPNLATLDVSSCRRLTDAAITAVAEMCPNLTQLNVSWCMNLTDVAIKKIAKKCRSLAELDVSECGNLTNAAITAVAANCANLAVLHVSECFNLTDTAIAAVAKKCPKLASLIVTDCSSLTDAAITAVAEKCPKLVQLDVSGCRNLSDAAITSVAEKCPNLAQLNVSKCFNLTDTAIAVVAKKCLMKLSVSRCEKLTDAAISAALEKCPNLAELDVSACRQLTDATFTAIAGKFLHLEKLNAYYCTNLTDAAIKKVAEKCPNLTKLYVGSCKNLTDAAIAAVAENCPNLAELEALSCGLTKLPDNIGNLSKLKFLYLTQNQLTALPRSIKELDSCVLDVDYNPLQTPPRDVARQGIPAIGRFYEQLDAGAVVARQLKVVLCGDAEAGKTSLRYAFRGEKQPRQAPDARTIHLDRESVRVPVDDEVKELMVNFFDMGGQETYGSAQAPFLTRSALFVLVVEANKACVKYADVAVLRFITLIQTRVPDATVQLVLSKIDELDFDDDSDERCKWLLDVVEDRLEKWREAVKSRNQREGKSQTEIPMIHVEKRVLAVSVGEELSLSKGVDAVRDAVVRLALSKARFPNVGQQVPLSWFEVWQFLRAIAEHGDESKAIDAMLNRTATKPLGVDDKDLAAEGAYHPLDELRAAWSIYCEQVYHRGDPDATFFDAIQLLEAQGGLFVDADLAFLQPQLIIEIMKPLVDHTLTAESDDYQPEFDEFLASHDTVARETLHNQLESFTQSGELGPEALVFLWRGLPHVKREHHGQLLQILHRSGVIFVLEKEANKARVAVVFSHLPSNVPKEQLAAAWPRRPRRRGVSERDMTVKFYTGGCPDSFLQRIVAATHQFGVSLCAWRKGIVVHHRNGRLYVRLLDEDSPEPKLVFSIRAESDQTDPPPWFSRVIELLEAEVGRLPGMDCAALVCCSRSECPQKNRQVVVWASKKEYTSNAVCQCGTALLGNTTSEQRLGDREILELLVQKADRTYRAVQQIPAEMKANRGAILKVMVDLAKGAHEYPSLFYVVPVQPSSDEGLIRRARSFFESKMMIVFVCAESKRSVKYGDEPGLEFSVLSDNIRTKVVAAAKFWKKYGRIAQVGASLLTTAINAAVNVNLEDLVPKEVSSVIGGVTTNADFIEKYAGMINDAVDKGMEYVEKVEKLEEQRSAADSGAGRDEIEARFTGKEMDEMKREYDVYIKEFLNYAGFNLEKFQETMKYRQLRDETGSTTEEWGWALKRRA